MKSSAEQIVRVNTEMIIFGNEQMIPVKSHFQLMLPLHSVFAERVRNIWNHRQCIDSPRYSEERESPFRDSLCLAWT